MKRQPTKADIVMWEQLKEILVCGAEKEWRFHGQRKWRFDFALLPSSPARASSHKIGIEIEGGVWFKGGGAHNRGRGFVDDMEKYNHATLLGWRVLRFTPEQVLKGEAIAFIQRVLET